MIIKRKNIYKMALCILSTIFFMTIIMSIDAFAATKQKINEVGLTNSINKAKSGDTISVSLKTTDNLTIPASIYKTLGASNNKGKKLHLLAQNEQNQTMYHWFMDTSKVDFYSDTEYTPVNLQVDFNCKMINAVKRHIGESYNPWYFTVAEPNTLWVPSVLTFNPNQTWKSNNDMKKLCIYRYNSFEDNFTLVAQNIVAASNGSVSVKLSDGGYYFLSDRKITPKKPFIMVNKISFMEDAPKLSLGDSWNNLSIGFSPCNAQNMDAVWTSSNSKIIKIVDTENGYFDCVGIGKATLTVKNPMSGISASITLTVGENTATIENEMSNYESKLAQEVVELVNKERLNAGLSELSYNDEELSKAVIVRSREMAKQYSHTRPDGTKFSTVLTKVKYNTAGENIAAGYQTADEVVKGWMNSPGHRANILNENYNYISVGVLVYNDKVYWVQLFKGLQ